MRSKPEQTTAVAVPASVALAGIALALGSGALGWRRPPGDTVGFDVVTAAELGAFLMFALLGALVILRRPRHPIGPLLAAVGLGVLLQQASQEYALLGAGPGSEPAGRGLAAWIATWSVTPPLTVLAIMLLLFPTGRPQSSAWRVVTWVVGASGTGVTLAWAAWGWSVRDRVLDSVSAVAPAPLNDANLALTTCLLVAVASLVLRYRAAGPDVRRQLRWLVLGALMLTVAAVAGIATTALGVSSRVVDALGSASLAGVAAAIALAILRYRLYEIDRILARTVSYLLVTVAIGIVYGTGVLVTGGLLDPGSSDSSVVVATSTLAAAGAFHPIRARTQRAVDRRFNRSHHDREVVVHAFGARLRDDVRLDALRADLLHTVAGVVQPTHASLWQPPSSATMSGRSPVT